MDSVFYPGGIYEIRRFLKKIIVLRGSERFYFNYKEVIKGKKMEQNIVLQNGDQIIVP